VSSSPICTIKIITPSIAEHNAPPAATFCEQERSPTPAGRLEGLYAVPPVRLDWRPFFFKITV
jgi:hypothetical protein